MSINLIYDDEIFIRQPFGGVSNIFQNIIKAADSNNNYKVFFKNYYSENDYIENFTSSAIPPIFKGINFPLKGKIIRQVFGGLSHHHTIKLIKNIKPALFHPTFYSEYYINTLKQRRDIKLIFTVHDLIHEKFPVNNHYIRIARIKEQNLKLASKIIAVSNSTKNDLLKTYDFLDESNISVIHLAHSLRNVKYTKHDNLPQKYILFVGERAGYKNFVTLAKAFAEISKTNEDLYLTCTGNKPFDAEELKLFTELNIQNRVIQLKLNSEELNYCYKNALLFVYPSLYEGFGIPVLEAFYNKIPVIVSNSSSLPEVASNGALLFEPNDYLDLKVKINNLLINQELRASLINKGELREKEFSWEKHINATFNLYQSIA